MARYKNGIQGPFSGKAGTVIGSKWRGTDYMKSLPRAYSKPPSQAQLEQRLKFALVACWLKPIKDLIWIGYQLFNGSKTPMNGAISFHLRNAVTGTAPDFRIDFSKAVFSRGELLSSWVKAVVPELNGILQVKWEDVAPSAFCNPTDQAAFVVYNPIEQKFEVVMDAGQRGDKELRLQLPEKFIGSLVHTWMFYVNEAKDNVSTAIYLGETTVI